MLVARLLLPMDFGFEKMDVQDWRTEHVARELFKNQLSQKLEIL